MTLQTQGAISLQDIGEEYQGTAPFKLSQYSEYVDKTPGTQIAISEFYGLSAKTLVLPDKTFEVYTTKSTIIPVANILEGSFDEYSDGNDPIRIVAVQNPVHGSVALNDTTVTFTSTGEAGISASFEYVAENKTGIQKVKQVLMNVLVIPPIICRPDTFSLQQGETLLIDTSVLIENDVDQSESGLSLTAVDTAVGGSVSINGSTISFISTGLSGEPAGFTYHVRNGVGVEQSGTVYITITPLTEIESYIYRLTSQVEDKKTVYTPPTMQDVFNNWARFDGKNYFTNKDSATGEAADWQFLTNPDRISMPDNSANGCGFVSPELLDNYTFEATVTSSDSDNDTIGLLIAFVREGSTNKFLALVRTQGGMAPDKGYGIIYSENGPWSPTWVIKNLDIGGTQGGYKNAQARIKIHRQGDMIECYTTHWNDVTNYQATSKITLDLNSDPRLAIFKGKQSYGYYTHSQANSTYLNTAFKGALDATRLFDTQLNQCWEYTDERWQLSGTIQSQLGYIRKVFNPETKERFMIKKSQVVYLGTEVTLSTLLAEKILDQRQYVLAGSVTQQNGAGSDVQLLALYAPGEEEKNYLKDKLAVQTTSAHADSPVTARYNNLGGKNWFSGQGIHLSGTDFTGGTVVFADGTVGQITDIGDDNGQSAFVAYEVVDYRLFDLSV
jgi:hypothetical protein